MRAIIIFSLLIAALFLASNPDWRLKPLQTNLNVFKGPMRNWKPGEPSLSVHSEIFNNLSLHLDDVEFLRNAFIVQAITGPLVRFSNRGRYEPYVAKSWTHDGTDWTFRLHDGLTCEDGQPITPAAFKRSLERSIRSNSPEDLKQTPFYELAGISTTADTLTLKFKKPVGKAVLEYLAMTPFSFLCDANFQGDQWISSGTFVSSGPYRVADFRKNENVCILERRQNWPLASDSSIQTLRIADKPDPSWPSTAQLEMTYSQPKGGSSEDRFVLEVPRALLSLRLGIENGQFFNDRSNRLALKAVVDEIADQSSIPFENYHRAKSFFVGQVTGHEQTIAPESKDRAQPSGPLKIRGFFGDRRSDEFYFDILTRALDRLGWPYEILSTPVASVKDFYAKNYDIAFDRSHVDATLDPDFVRLLFKSKLGPRYQDPGNRVSSLVDRFDSGKLTYRDFLISFNSILAEEAAIIPLYHRGLVFRFTGNIDIGAISPLMSIVRYEELVVGPNGN